MSRSLCVAPKSHTQETETDMGQNLLGVYFMFPTVYILSLQLICTGYIVFIENEGIEFCQGSGNVTISTRS